MSHISKIVDRHRDVFSKSNDITPEMNFYRLETPSGKEIGKATKKPPFSWGGEGGIPVYYDEDSGKIYMDQSDRHSAVIGSTGSKKSRLLAMPIVMTLGAAGESMIVSDPKAEIFLRTAEYLREHNYSVEVLNLREPQYGSAWNPLYVPYLLYQDGQIDRAYEFANDVAVNLINIEKSQKEPFWDNSAGSFFFGLILLLFKYCKERNEPIEAVNIGNIIRLRNALCSNGISAIRNRPVWKYAKSDPFIESTLIGTVETANDTRAGILSVFDEKMRSFYIQPSLLGMLAHNDISYASLVGEKPTAFFLILPDEKTGYHNLVALFVKQSYEYLVSETQKNFFSGSPLTKRINYILDEFSSLPTISDFPAMITAARSRNIRFHLFLQSKHQLRLRYGEESDMILSNCENWFFLTSREISFLKELSDLCGMDKQSHPILSVSDLQRLDKNKGEVLVLSGRNKPFLSRLADIDKFTKPRKAENIYAKSQIRFQQDIEFSFSDSKMTSLLSGETPKNVAEEANSKQEDPVDIDALVKSIDEQIAQLEEEQKQEEERRKKASAERKGEESS